jgi:D-3-phosphoglycerate dehydrogenase
MAILMLARNVSAITTALRGEPWDQARLLGAQAREITGLVAGIVGVGEIGRRLARILHAGFGMRVLGNQRRLDRLPPEAAPVSLGELVAQADFVVVTCPLTPETHHLFDRARIGAMKAASLADQRRARTSDRRDGARRSVARAAHCRRDARRVRVLSSRARTPAVLA